MTTVAFNPCNRVKGYKKPLSVFTRRDGYTRPVTVEIISKQKPAQSPVIRLNAGEFTRRDGLSSPVIGNVSAQNSAKAPLSNLWIG